jgi:hypothetical protein
MLNVRSLTICLSRCISLCKTRIGGLTFCRSCRWARSVRAKDRPGISGLQTESLFADQFRRRPGRRLRLRLELVENKMGTEQKRKICLERSLSLSFAKCCSNVFSRFPFCSATEEERNRTDCMVSFNTSIHPISGLMECSIFAFRPFVPHDALVCVRSELEGSPSVQVVVGLDPRRRRIGQKITELQTECVLAD